MDRLKAMEVLVASVESGNAATAAKQLGLTPDRVRRDIADLESYLGRRLVTYAGRLLKPTEAGEIYAAGARRILRDIAALEREAVPEVPET